MTTLRAAGSVRGRARDRADSQPGLALLLTLLAAACTSEPVPLSAQAGSTLLVALGDEAIVGGSVGYASPYRGFDDQRGELRLELVGNEGSGLEPVVLHTRYVTRVHADPASHASIFPHLFDWRLALVLALVDIPPDTPPGTYEIRYARRRRVDATTYEDLTPVVPPAGTLLSVLPPEIDLAGPDGAPRTFAGTENPAIGYAGSAWFDLTDELGRYVPYPKLVVGFHPAWDLPAAAHLEIRYPLEKIRIEGVIEEDHPSRGSVVRWSDSRSEGRLRIDVVDPDRSVRGISVVFRLLDFPSKGRAELGDFEVTSSMFYGLDGAPDRDHAALVKAIR